MSTSTTAALSPELPKYILRSDLAQYCLPSATRDETRKLAWASSICVLFLIVAALGLRQPVFVIQAVAPPAEPLVVVHLPPTDQDPPPPPEESEEQPEELIDDLIEVPAIAPVVVAPPDSASFSVPIDGYTVVATDPRLVPPPPAIIPKAPPENLPRAEFRAIRYGDKTFRKQPPPNYPVEFQRSRVGGTIEALIYVGTNGAPTKVEVGKSSGVPSLDRHVCEFIHREWRAAPGEAANYRIAITFAP